MTAPKTCTVYKYNENHDCVGMCDIPATAVYSKPNENAGPRQPTVLTYPRCRTHDTPAIRKKAEEQGFDREEV